MKERLKKFVREHEIECIFAGAFATMTTIYVASIIKEMDGNRIAFVGDKEHDDMMCIQIVKKNGETSFWHKNLEK